MRPFYVFLCDRNAAGGFSTEDTLACFLPLVRQVVAAHAVGKVAPLVGLKDLNVEGVRIWFEEGKLAPPELSEKELQRVAPAMGAVEVVEETHRTADIKTGEEQVVSALIGKREEPITKPVFLPGYVSWEHEVGHHDPLTDIFSLGLILASLTCGLDLHEPEDLARFVANRRNPFKLVPDLHPVLAQAIVRMTELDRQRRPLELSRILRSLENYRDQAVDLEIELAQDSGFATRDLHGKQQVVLARLQDRLFEISRRNRLLHFKATLQTVNLTQASVPLSFDVRNIRPDQILTWNKSFQQDLVTKGPLTLNKYLNFAEALYLPGVLDKIRAEASRDEKEYGFAQLRLVACFLHWSDLKSTPPERYDSPLVLVPVKLTKKKGIRDTFQLEMLSAEAEINPVIRHQFKQLYDIELPEYIDLEQTDLDAFYELISAAIGKSESAVTLTKVDRPRIDLIHQKAQRRLDKYQRAARIGGKGARTYLDLDYSYDPANYHPLGLRLFNERIRPAVSRLRSMLEKSPRPRQFAVPPQDDEGEKQRDFLDLGLDKPAKRPEPPDLSLPKEEQAEKQAEEKTESAKSQAADSRSEGPETKTDQKPAENRESEQKTPQPQKEVAKPRVVEHSREFYNLRKGDEEENPYAWEFDLCGVTLGNFKYRKMSLVRDYTALVESQPECAAFDSIFSLVPKPIEKEPDAVPPLEERFHVVPCDPTQAASVAKAKLGGSYIIQGPPGTGKSQTITNLIADYVVRGKRVLFVCEKRAAIDVVYVRLKQQGLSELCCLIHDSQADKKDFVMDLKETYETFLADGDGEKKAARRREKLLKDVQEELEPLEDYDAWMQSVSPEAGIKVRELINVAVGGSAPPALSGLIRERLPNYAEFKTCQPQLAKLRELMIDLQPEGVLARHPFRLLSPRLAKSEQPLAELQNGLREAQTALDHLVGSLEKTGRPREEWNTPQSAAHLFKYATRIYSLVQAQQLDLLNPSTPLSILLKQLRSDEKLAQGALETAVARTKHWQRKLAPEELEIALNQARGYEGSFLRFFSPGWWRLRGIMRECYDFSQHVIQPTWTQVLGFLKDEYAAQAEHDQVETRARDQFGFAGSLREFDENIQQIRQDIDRLPAPTAALHRQIIEQPDQAKTLLDPVFSARESEEALTAICNKILIGTEDCPWDELKQELARLEQAAEGLPRFLPGLELLAEMPPKVAAAVRELPLELSVLEQAIADATLEKVLNTNPGMQRFDARARDKVAGNLETQIDSWQQSNAEFVRQRVRSGFLENVQRTADKQTPRDPAEAEFKKRYSRGRRELEHEFGKSMRYRAIRDLVEGDTALVVRDLKPVWLMSPLSVSDTLPLDSSQFDVVIFDEASQVTLEGAIPCIFRSPQAIVVGDEMQLPPTNFFATKRDEEEDSLMVEDEGETVEYSLDSNSLLNHASRNLPSTMLGWHYRSRSESLISFSNWAFYGGRLLTVPEEQVSTRQVPEIRSKDPGEGAQYVDDLLARPLSFHFMSPGYYEKRRNRIEADYIAQLVRGLLQRDEKHSIGIIAFSEAQQGEIEDALERLAEQDEEFRQQLDAEYEREEDGQFVGLLVKNLENIQGDERDVVILSVCYGYDRERNMRMNFGPINVSGGEKRLNVAFSRSKKFMAVISSIQSTDITNEHNEGANCLKNYLRYAAAASVGSSTTTEQVLHDLARWRGRADNTPTSERDPVAESLAAALEEQGYCVDRDVGQSHFRCDLAVRKADDAEYRLGILLDTARYYRQRDLLERDMLKPKLLRAFGWRVKCVLSKDWYAGRVEVLRELLEELQD